MSKQCNNNKQVKYIDMGNVQSSLGILPSALDRSMMSPDNGLAGRCVADREPRRHMMADLSREKFSLHLMRCSVFP